MNENPLGVSPWVRKVLHNTATLCHMYPYPAIGQLKNAISRYFDIHPSEVILGAGSTDVLRIAMDVLSKEATQLVCPAPGFKAAEVLAHGLGMPIHACYFGSTEDIPLAAMRKTVESHPGVSIVYLSHPDCYSGSVLPFEWLGDWIASLEGRAYVIVDEAYIEFTQGRNVSSLVALVRRGIPHVFVLRTFSKAYGLAGLRVGYGIGQLAQRPDIVARSSLSCPLSLPAAHAALAALDNPEWLEHSLWLLSVARDMLTEGLTRLGLSFIAGPVNFLLHRIPDGCNADFVRTIEALGIRILGHIEGLPEFCRVTIGCAEDVHAYLIALNKLLRK